MFVCGGQWAQGQRQWAAVVLSVCFCECGVEEEEGRESERARALLLNCSVCMVVLCRAIVGELDEEVDVQIDLSKVHAEPLKAVVH